MTTLSPLSEDRTPQVLEALSTRAEKKRFVAPRLTRYDRMPAVTGNSTIVFPDFP